MCTSFVSDLAKSGQVLVLLGPCTRGFSVLSTIAQLRKALQTELLQSEFALLALVLIHRCRSNV